MHGEKRESDRKMQCQQQTQQTEIRDVNAELIATLLNTELLNPFAVFFRTAFQVNQQWIAPNKFTCPGTHTNSHKHKHTSVAG